MVIPLEFIVVNPNFFDHVNYLIILCRQVSDYVMTIFVLRKILFRWLGFHLSNQINPQRI